MLGRPAGTAQSVEPFCLKESLIVSSIGCRSHHGCLALSGVNLAKNLEIVQMVNDLEGEEVWGDWEMHHPALAARDWCDSGACTHFHLLHCIHIAQSRNI